MAASWIDRRRRSLAFGTVLLAVAVMVFPVVSCESVWPTGGQRVELRSRQEPDIRVRVRKVSTASRIDGPALMVLRAVGTTVSVPASPPIAISAGVGGVNTVDARGASRAWGPGVMVEIFAREPLPGSPVGGFVGGDQLAVDGEVFAGTLTVVPRTAVGDEAGAPTVGAFDIVATMPMELYVPGVLAKELYPHWPRQAFEAQAVAARSYALHERVRARREGRRYDVESTTLDQAFGGVTVLPVAVEAARATRGWVLTYEGAGGGGILRAYYSSTCGGRPASASKVWPTTNGLEFNLAPPIQGRPREFYCQDARYFRWQVERDTEELGRRIRGWGRQVGHAVRGLSRLRACDMLEQNDAGRPNRYRLTDDKGRTFTLFADDLRVACNFAGEGMPAPAAEAVVRSGDLVMTVAGTRTRIEGRGFGHGVGLCQFCARGMAGRGMDWRSMLAVFYPGSVPKKQY